MTVVHIVLFKFKPDVDGNQTLEFVRGLKDRVPEVDTVQLGVNFNTERAKGFTHGFTMTFKDKGALDAYDKSQAHIDAVKEYIAPITEDLLIFDYEVENFSFPPPAPVTADS
ncbi:hypothetical protein BGX34_001287 [Mortierella sp. NVP85]|nr:hypothetical protein BGX34_001287 [Mortierella sp. NVP85]